MRPMDARSLYFAVGPDGALPLRDSVAEQLLSGGVAWDAHADIPRWRPDVILVLAAFTLADATGIRYLGHVGVLPVACTAAALGGECDLRGLDLAAVATSMCQRLEIHRASLREAVHRFYVDPILQEEPWATMGAEKGPGIREAAHRVIMSAYAAGLARSDVLDLSTGRIIPARTPLDAEMIEAHRCGNTALQRYADAYALRWNATVLPVPMGSAVEGRDVALALKVGRTGRCATLHLALPTLVNIPLDSNQVLGAAAAMAYRMLQSGHRYDEWAQLQRNHGLASNRIAFMRALDGIDSLSHALGGDEAVTELSTAWLSYIATQREAARTA